MIVNPIATVAPVSATELLTCAPNRSKISSSAAATAGSPIQPSASEASVIPSWVAEM